MCRARGCFDERRWPIADGIVRRVEVKQAKQAKQTTTRRERDHRSLLRTIEASSDSSLLAGRISPSHLERGGRVSRGATPKGALVALVSSPPCSRAPQRRRAPRRSSRARGARRVVSRAARVRARNLGGAPHPPRWTSPRVPCPSMTRCAAMTSLRQRFRTRPPSPTASLRRPPPPRRRRCPGARARRCARARRWWRPR